MSCSNQNLMKPLTKAHLKYCPCRRFCTAHRKHFVEPCKTALLFKMCWWNWVLIINSPSMTRCLWNPLTLRIYCTLWDHFEPFLDEDKPNGWTVSRLWMNQSVKVKMSISIKLTLVYKKINRNKKKVTKSVGNAFDVLTQNRHCGFD